MSDVRSGLPHTERLSLLERNMVSILGNGQPGRLSKIEGKIDEIKWWIIISVLLGSGGAAALQHFIKP